MHAAARQQRDLLRAEEPGRGLGGVAGVGVLGQEDDEPSVELAVERGEDERQAGSETRALVPRRSALRRRAPLRLARSSSRNA